MIANSEPKAHQHAWKTWCGSPVPGHHIMDLTRVSLDNKSIHFSPLVHLNSLHFYFFGKCNEIRVIISGASTLAGEGQQNGVEHIIQQSQAGAHMFPSYFTWN
jgi:hypothetical protein